jgi:hypothetical protein
MHCERDTKLLRSCLRIILCIIYIFLILIKYQISTDSMCIYFVRKAREKHEVRTDVQPSWGKYKLKIK